MSKRTALWTAVIGCLAACTVMAADASPSALNVLRDLTSQPQSGAMIVGVTGTYPILDYTYYDYDPETFVVDMADVDVSQLPKTLLVNAGGVGTREGGAHQPGQGPGARQARNPQGLPGQVHRLHRGERAPGEGRGRR